MPRIKRWSPISHDFNRDPELIQARRDIADWIGYVWIEMLSIADRNEGKIPGTPEQIADILAPISLQKYLKSAANRVRIFLEFGLNLGWIRVEKGYIEVVNYAKYHRTREPNWAPSEPDRTKPNLIKKEEEKNKRAQAPLRFEPPEWVPRESWEGFVEYRKRVRKPLTPRAMTLTVKELERLKLAGQSPAAVLDQSVANGWVGVFPVREQSNGAGGRAARPSDAANEQIAKILAWGKA